MQQRVKGKNSSCQEIMPSLLFFCIYGQFVATLKPHSRRIEWLFGSQIFIETFNLAKTENRNKKL